MEWGQRLESNPTNYSAYRHLGIDAPSSSLTDEAIRQAEAKLLQSERSMAFIIGTLVPEKAILPPTETPLQTIKQDFNVEKLLTMAPSAALAPGVIGSQAEAGTGALYFRPQAGYNSLHRLTMYPAGSVVPIEQSLAFITCNLGSKDVFIQVTASADLKFAPTLEEFFTKGKLLSAAFRVFSDNMGATQNPNYGIQGKMDYTCVLDERDILPDLQGPAMKQQCYDRKSADTAISVADGVVLTVGSNFADVLTPLNLNYVYDPSQSGYISDITKGVPLWADQSIVDSSPQSYWFSPGDLAVTNLPASHQFTLPILGLDDSVRLHFSVLSLGRNNRITVNFLCVQDDGSGRMVTVRSSQTSQTIPVNGDLQLVNQLMSGTIPTSPLYVTNSITGNPNSLPPMMVEQDVDVEFRLPPNSRLLGWQVFVTQGTEVANNIPPEPNMVPMPGSIVSCVSALTNLNGGSAVTSAIALPALPTASAINFYSVGQIVALDPATALILFGAAYVTAATNIIPGGGGILAQITRVQMFDFDPTVGAHFVTFVLGFNAPIITTNPAIAPGNIFGCTSTCVVTRCDVIATGLYVAGNLGPTNFVVWRGLSTGGNGSSGSVVQISGTGAMQVVPSGRQAQLLDMENTVLATDQNLVQLVRLLYMSRSPWFKVMYKRSEYQQLLEEVVPRMTASFLLQNTSLLSHPAIAHKAHAVLGGAADGIFGPLGKLLSKGASLAMNVARKLPLGQIGTSLAHGAIDALGDVLGGTGSQQTVGSHMHDVLLHQQKGIAADHYGNVRRARELRQFPRHVGWADEPEESEEEMQLLESTGEWGAEAPEWGAEAPEWGADTFTDILSTGASLLPFLADGDFESPTGKYEAAGLMEVTAPDGTTYWTTQPANTIKGFPEAKPLPHKFISGDTYRNYGKVRWREIHRNHLPSELSADDYKKVAHLGGKPVYDVYMMNPERGDGWAKKAIFPPGTQIKYDNMRQRIYEAKRNMVGTPKKSPQRQQYDALITAFHKWKKDLGIPTSEPGVKHAPLDSKTRIELGGFSETNAAETTLDFVKQPASVRAEILKELRGMREFSHVSNAIPLIQHMAMSQYLQMLARAKDAIRNRPRPQKRERGPQFSQWYSGVTSTAAPLVE